MADETQRRDFLRTAGAALGGIAVTMTAGDATAASAGMMAMSRGTRTLTLRCGSGVTIENLMLALKQGLGHAGCTGCGLVGIDVVLHSGDPAMEFKIDAPGIQQATLG